MTDTISQLQNQDNQFIHPLENISSLDKNRRTVIKSGNGIYITDTEQ